MDLSRRRLLASLAAAAVWAARPARAFTAIFGEDAPQFFRSRRPKPAPTPIFVFFGTDTAKPGAKGIYVSRFDSNGQLSPATLAIESYRPSFLAKSRPNGKAMLYAANEADDENATLSSFTLNDQTGTLILAGKTSSGGHGACYISVDVTGQSAFVADYAGSAVASYRVQPDGTLSEPVSRIDFKEARFGKRGPVAARQDAPHPHSATLSPDNRFLVVNDLGSDTIVTFPIDVGLGILGPPRVNQRRAGSGPRHVAFHPNGRWVYGIDELSNQVDQMLWDATRGDLHSGTPPEALLTGTDQPVSTLAPGFHGANTAAEIVVAPSGGFLYASNRGENSIAVFSIDQTNGKLKPVQRIGCGGRTPRQFTLDPSGQWLLCGNQDSDTVTVFRRNPGDGRLTGPTQTLAVPAPLYTLFVS